jgi:hypothetical protein
MGWAYGTYGGRERCTKILVGKAEGKGPFRRPKRRWEKNIKIDLKELGRGFGDWMDLSHVRTGGGRL